MEITLNFLDGAIKEEEEKRAELLKSINKDAEYGWGYYWTQQNCIALTLIQERIKMLEWLKLKIVS